MQESTKQIVCHSKAMNFDHTNIKTTLPNEHRKKHTYTKETCNTRNKTAQARKCTCET